VSDSMKHGNSHYVLECVGHQKRDDIEILELKRSLSEIMSDIIDHKSQISASVQIDQAGDDTVKPGESSYASRRKLRSSDFLAKRERYLPPQI
jgi:hypothetical protein